MLQDSGSGERAIIKIIALQYFFSIIVSPVIISNTAATGLKIPSSDIDEVSDIRSVTNNVRAVFEFKEYVPVLGFYEALDGHCSLGHSSGSIEYLSKRSFHNIFTPHHAYVH